MQEEKKLYPFPFSEIQDLGYIDSPVEGGWLAGNTISEIMEMYMDRIVGEHVFAYYGRQFPVLVRALDGAERTPLLVCPDDETAEQRFDFLGKAKFWYVRDAKPGAKLLLGFKRDSSTALGMTAGALGMTAEEGVSAEAFYNACKDGSVEAMLNAVEPHPGDCFFIPPGLVHAALEGVSLVEIAESSPLDFRLFDWGRPFDGDAFDAELTLEAAFDFIDFRGFTPGAAPAAPQPVETLAGCDAFTVSRIRLSDPLRVPGEQLDSFRIYTCLQGGASVQATLEGPSPQRFPLRPGGSLLVPAELGDFLLVPDAPDTVLLETTVERRTLRDTFLNNDSKGLS